MLPFLTEYESMRADFMERLTSNECIADLTCQLKKEATDRNAVQAMNWLVDLIPYAVPDFPESKYEHLKWSYENSNFDDGACNAQTCLPPAVLESMNLIDLN